MKKITLLLFLFSGMIVFSQEMREYTHKVNVQQNKGIEYVFHSEITRTNPKKKRTEYRFTLRWTNITDEDIYYLAPVLGSKFGDARVARMEAYFWDLKGEDTGLKIGNKKVYVLKAGKTYEEHYWEKWFKDKDLSGEALDLMININYGKITFANSIDELKG